MHMVVFNKRLRSDLLTPILAKTYVGLVNCYVVIFVVTTVLMLSSTARAQLAKPDSLRSALTITTNDTLKIVLLTKLTDYYSETNPDSSFAYANELARVANRLSFKLDEAHARVDCRLCHPQVRTASGVITKYKPVKSGCGDCHGLEFQK